MAHVCKLIQLPLIDSFDRWIYDQRLQFSFSNKPDLRIVIVDIDEASLEQEGHWPWPRRRLAQLINTLFDTYHAKTLGMDMVFAESDDSSGLHSLQQLAHGSLSQDIAFQRNLASLAPSLNDDQLFANALARHDVVLGYYFTGTTRRHGLLPAPLFQDTQANMPSWSSNVAQGYGANLPLLQMAAAGAGHFNPLVDADGQTRRVSLLTQYSGGYYPPLSFVVFQHATASKQSQLIWPADAPQPEALQTGSYTLPMDEQTAVLIPYRGPAGSFPYVSAADILNRKIKISQLANKIILLGSTSPGLQDLRATPAGQLYPGVEIHANLIAGMLDNALPQQPQWVAGANLILLLALLLLCLYLLPSCSLLQSALLAATLLLPLLAADSMLWLKLHIAWPSAAPIVFITLVSSWHAGYGYFTEYRSKRQLGKLFGKYIPPALVEKMQDDPKSYKMHGQNKELSVMFTDIRGFTSLAEHMPAEELGRLLNRLMDLQTKVINQHLGTIDKFIGDAVMAFWNAPLDDPAHARHAIDAALELQEAMKHFNQQNTLQGLPELQIGIGINTGPAVVGDMGSSLRRAYTAIGDSVNLAARLEGQTKNYNVPILIGETTASRLADEIDLLELDRLRVKGKQKPTRVFWPVDQTTRQCKNWRKIKEKHQKAIDAYYKADWKQAILLFEELDNEKYYPLAKHYLSHIHTLSTDTKNTKWNGITDAMQK
ncbi:adenylate cyclase [Aquitalea magnusonii]|uniref:Adenylate cyclase n=2 Tax=Aquitalea magnusonii TaxID=332411 RepID=A0A318J2T6_9NEIS|nr:adenylate cyclase [Aquitalea magnusonii]